MAETDKSVDEYQDYLRYVTAEMGWSLSELAKKAGVAHTTLTRPGKRGPNLDTLRKIEAVTGIAYGERGLNDDLPIGTALPGLPPKETAMVVLFNSLDGASQQRMLRLLRRLGDQRGSGGDHRSDSLRHAG